jgi:hypothetical protein
VISIPSLTSSPCIRGAPHFGLLRLIIRIKSRTSCGTAGRPGFPCWTFHVQYRRKPLRCQAMTVSGRTISRADFQSVQSRRNQTHKIRSAGLSFSRFGADRRSTPSRCRNATFSNRSSTEVLKQGGKHVQERKQPLKRRPQEQVTLDQPQSLQNVRNILEGQFSVFCAFLSNWCASQISQVEASRAMN